MINQSKDGGPLFEFWVEKMRLHLRKSIGRRIFSGNIQIKEKETWQQE